MDAELFNLTWDAFQNSAKETFKSLIHEDDFMDVTLASEDNQQLRAHKVILSACSPFFKNILVKNPHPSPLIYLSGVSFRDLKTILNFMYLGETNVEQCHLDSFMAACTKLKVRGLTEPDVQEAASREKDNKNNTRDNSNYFPGDTDNSSNSYSGSKDNSTYSRAAGKDNSTYFQSKDTRNYSSISKDYSQATNVKTEQDPVSTTEHSAAVTKLELMEENSSSYGGKFYCKKCEFETLTKANLKRHNEMKHIGVKYQCEGCDYKASSKDNLKRHSMSKHEGVVFSCYYCEFKSSLKGSVSRHEMKMHTGLGSLLTTLN